MSLFDINQDSQRAVDNAFSAGEHRGFQRGRKVCDEHVLAECVELRVERDALRVRLERRESWRATLMNVGVAALVFACWALIAFAVFMVAS